jgi:hypothetical protein
VADTTRRLVADATRFQPFGFASGNNLHHLPPSGGAGGRMSVHGGWLPPQDSRRNLHHLHPSTRAGRRRNAHLRLRLSNGFARTLSKIVHHAPLTTPSGLRPYIPIPFGLRPKLPWKQYSGCHGHNTPTSTIGPSVLGSGSGSRSDSGSGFIYLNLYLST